MVGDSRAGLEELGGVMSTLLQCVMVSVHYFYRHNFHKHAISKKEFHERALCVLYSRVVAEL